MIQKKSVSKWIKDLTVFNDVAIINARPTLQIFNDRKETAEIVELVKTCCVTFFHALLFTLTDKVTGNEYDVEE